MDHAKLREHRFKTDKKESCTAQVAVRIPPSLKEKLKEKKGWQEQVRQYMEKIVELESA